MVGHRAFLTATALALPVALAACAGASDRYPSLAIRDVERISGVFEPVGPADKVILPKAAPEGQEAQLESLVAQAQAAHRQFLSIAPATRDLILAVEETGPDSNAWAAAQVALADLDSQRSLAAIALGDLDLLYAEASTGFVEREEIASARQQVIEWIEQEDAILAGLRAQADR